MTDELDLHTFQPRDCADVVEGTGTLRRIVQSVLDKHPAVASYTQADANWGATRVELKRS